MAENSANNKLIAKNTIFLYIRSLFLMVISLYTSRVTLQMLGVDDFGIYQVVGGIVAMFTIIGTTLSSASQRFITFAIGEGNPQNLKNVFSTSVTLHIALGLLVVIMLEIIGTWFLNNKLNIPTERLTVANWVMQFSIVSFFMNTISVPFNSTIIAHERMNAFAYMGIVEGVLKLLGAFSLMLISWDKLYFYSLYLLFVSLFMQVCYMVYSYSNFTETRSISFRIDKSLFNKMFNFVGWNFFGNGSLVLRNQGVDIVLNMFFGVVVNAAKGISNQVMNAVMQLVGNFTTAMKPQLTMSIAQKNYTRTYSIVNKGTKYSFLLLLIMSVPIMTCTNDIMVLWLGKIPDYTVAFVRWTLVYLLIDSFSKMLIHAILSEGNIRNYQIMVGGTKLLAVPIVIIVVILGGGPLVGVWVNIVLEIVCLLERFYYCKKLLSFNYLCFCREVIFPCVFIGLISMLLPMFFLDYVTNSFFVKFIVSGLWTLIIIFVLGLTKNERNLLKTYVNKNRI